MKKRHLTITGAAILSIGFIAASGMLTAAQVCAAEEQVSFKEDVLPLLKWRCAGCHEGSGEGVQKSGLDLSSYAGLMKGTKFGKMVIAGDADSSNLMRLLDWRVSPGNPHAARQEAVVQLRPQLHPHLDQTGREGQLTL